MKAEDTKVASTALCFMEGTEEYSVFLQHLQRVLDSGIKFSDSKSVVNCFIWDRDVGAPPGYWYGLYERGI